MEVRIEREVKQCGTVVPRVGEAYTYEDSNSVFVRINDEQGALTLSERKNDNYIYCVVLDEGRISYARKDVMSERILLEPKDGELVFVPKAVIDK